MRLALAEIRHEKGRFASIVASLALITFLVLTLSALSDGLFYGSTGAIRSSNASAYAFDSQASGSLVRSQLPATDVAKFAAQPGVEKASPVGVLLTSGTGPDGMLDLAVFGVESDGVGVPASVSQGRLPNAGSNEAAVDSRLTKDGVKLGSTITVGTTPVTVVGITPDTAYQLQPSLWTSVTNWRAMQEQVRPETRGQNGLISAVALQLAKGTEPASVALPNTTVLSSDATGLAIPGVEQQRSTLNSIIYTTILVSAIVVALFFALLVLEKRELFAALKALGTSTWKLAKSVIFQAFVASVLGLVLGIVISRLVGLVLPATVPTLFRTESTVSVGIFIVISGLLGAAFSLRRIAKIDPATALGGQL